VKWLSEKINQNQKKHEFVSLMVFLLTITIILITLISVIFPALILGINNDFPKYPEKINIYELGILAYPLLTSFVVVGLVIIYSKNKFPNTFTKSINFILGFEISSKIAFLVVVVLLGLYIILTIDEIFQEEPWEDYTRAVKPNLEKWSIQEFTSPTSNPLAFFFETTSMNIFGNYKIIPFIASSALLVLTYFITVQISKKKFAGIISLVFVLSSTIFLTYDTSITYPNFWILFYLLSLFTINKVWPLSSISFIFAALSKELTIFFLPMTLFFIYRSNLAKKKKFQVFVSYLIIVILGIVIVFLKGKDSLSSFTYDSHEFWSGFTTIASQFRFDGLFIIFLLPLTIGLFILSTSGFKSVDAIMVLILGMLLLAPIISGFTTYGNAPYRFIPLIIFIAIGVGVLFSKRVS
jgi:hypothetical protein